MKQKLMRISCDPVCGFMIQSHNEKEVVDFGKSHVKNVHKMKVSDSDVKAMMKSV